MIVSDFKVYLEQIKIPVLKYYYEDNELISYLENKIISNIKKEFNNITNVPNMTNWKFFLEDENFKKFINNQFYHIVNAYITFFGHGPKGFILNLNDAWGNILKKGEEVKPHDHLGTAWTTVMYFNKGTPLYTTFGKFEIKRGLILTMPGFVHHWVPKIEEEERLSLVWNWQTDPVWE